MMETLKKLIGLGSRTDYMALMKRGAVIVDVRTPSEYLGGHIPGSLNIPLQQIPGKLSGIPKEKVVITCCASGMRSGAAKNILKSNRYKEVYNGGSWFGLLKKIV